MNTTLRRIADMYIDGFRNMTVGRKLWLLIAVKVILFFAILRLFFFPNILSENYDNDADRAEAVATALSRE
ncbi:MAG: DUF4492 domain-containing protein [Muribaculaceae bacterium]|nr:DUF4492 domain-containing protein [Muribaculaceae bacterium]